MVNIIKKIKNRINEFVPTEDILLYFYVSCWIYLISQEIATKMFMFGWFIISGLIVASYSRDIQLWIKNKADQ